MSPVFESSSQGVHVHADVLALTELGSLPEVPWGPWAARGSRGTGHPPLEQSPKRCSRVTNPKRAVPGPGKHLGWVRLVTEQLPAGTFTAKQVEVTLQSQGPSVPRRP